jgi:hypothetical protein
MESISRQNPSLAVKGIVQRVTGAPVPDADVVAYDVDLRSWQELAKDRTASDGGYILYYTKDAFARAEKGSADLCIVVKPPPASGITKSKPSDILFNAPDVATIDIVLDGDSVVGPSEYAALVAAITPVLGDVHIHELVDDDVRFLVGETSVDEANLRLLIIADAHSSRTPKVHHVPTDIFYGMMRHGRPTDFTLLVSTSADDATAAIHAAINANTIDRRSEKEVLATVQHLGLLTISLSAGVPFDGVKPPALSRTLLATVKDPKPFLQTLAAESTSVEAFWDTVSKQSETKDDVERLKFGVQLGGILLNHEPLVKEIFRQQDNKDITGFVDLATFSEKRWRSFVDRADISVPAEIPGESIEDKKQTYVKAITQIVEDSLPTAFFSSRLTDDDDDATFGSLPGKDDVVRFFKNSPSFDIRSTFRVAHYIDRNKDSVAGIKDVERLKSLISGAQRLHAVAPRYSLVRPLLTDGIDSSLKISRMGENAFMAKYAGVLGRQDALLTFDRAQYAHSMAFALLADFGSKGLRYDIASIKDVVATDINSDDGTPDWQELFGSADLCSCDGCHAMDSPAAYLVDVLHFLRDRRIPDMSTVVRDRTTGQIKSVMYRQRTLPGTDKRVDVTAKDVLFERRRDIGEIQLTCGNTNTPLPYIDLVVEILEDEVSPPPPFSAFDLPARFQSQLDARNIDELRNEFDPPLSQYAFITVVKPGIRWTIDEPSCTYTITVQNPGTANSVARVVTRSRQTTGTPQERAASPQYVNSAAYELLAKSVYPWNLPYDLALDTVRTYLAHLTVDRRDLMEAFSPLSRRTDVLNDVPIAYETLQLNTTEAGIINGTIDSQADSASPGIWNLWGYKTQTVDGQSWQSVVTGKVETFLQQSKLKYAELLDLVEIGRIFGGKAIRIVPVPQAPEDTCQLDKLRLAGVSPQILWKMARFLRLWRKLDGWSIIDLAKTIIVRETY